MAQKRMFTMAICDSDAFLEMPLSAQCLYFHLNMRADDDGFVGNPKRIVTLVKATEDDLKLLIAKSFILTFDNGVIVIKHWRMHNCITQNRYHPTNYIDEKRTLLIKDNKSYSFTSGVPLAENDKAQKLNTQNAETCDGLQVADKRLTNGLQMADRDLDSVNTLNNNIYNTSFNNINTDNQNTNTDINIKTDISNNKKANTKTKEVHIYYPDEKLNQTFLEYIEMRNKIKRPMTDHAIDLAMRKLKELSTLPFSDDMDNDLAIKILEQSILSDYQGLFPLKENGKGGNKQENGFEYLARQIREGGTND